MKKLLLYITGLLPFLITSCEEDITLDVPPYTPKLAVYCVLYADTVPTLFLNQSKAYFDYTDAGQETEYIDKAQVLIEDLDAHIVDTLKPTTDIISLPGGGTQEMHFYAGKNTIKQGGRYKLTVNYNGQTVTGETKVPSPISLTKDDISFTQDSGVYETYYHFTIKAHDPANEENAYELAVDRGSDPYYYSREFIYDGSANGKDVILRHDYYYYPDPWGGDTLSVTFQVDDYTRTTAEYIESVYSQGNNDGNPFTEPVIIRHNVTGGLGVFGAAAKGNSITIKVR